MYLMFFINKICRRHRAILKLLNQIIKRTNLHSTYHKIKKGIIFAYYMMCYGYGKEYNGD